MNDIIAYIIDILCYNGQKISHLLLVNKAFYAAVDRKFAATMRVMTSDVTWNYIITMMRYPYIHNMKHKKLFNRQLNIYMIYRGDIQDNILDIYLHKQHIRISRCTSGKFEVSVHYHVRLLTFIKKYMPELFAIISL